MHRSRAAGRTGGVVLITMKESQSPTFGWDDDGRTTRGLMNSSIFSSMLFICSRSSSRPGTLEPRSITRAAFFLPADGRGEDSRSMRHLRTRHLRAEGRASGARELRAGRARERAQAHSMRHLDAGALGSPFFLGLTAVCTAGDGAAICGGAAIFRFLRSRRAGV